MRAVVTECVRNAFYIPGEKNWKVQQQFSGQVGTTKHSGQILYICRPELISETTFECQPDENGSVSKDKPYHSCSSLSPSSFICSLCCQTSKSCFFFQQSRHVGRVKVRFLENLSQKFSFPPNVQLVTVYKSHERLRVQILHELTPFLQLLSILKSQLTVYFSRDAVIMCSG